MAKYFLGSVGEAEAYRVTSSLSGAVTMDLVFTSKTLTDSAVNISVNKEQIIDSYNGAPAGVFYHSPTINITLSDILWNPKFVEVSLGSQFNKMCDNGNVEYFMTSKTSNGSGEIILTEPYPTTLGIPGMNNQSIYLITATIQNRDEWFEITDYNSTTHKISDLRPNTQYCLKYLIVSNQSTVINVTARIIPDELFLVITTPVFIAEGDCVDGTVHVEDPMIFDYNASSGKMVGKIIYEVPRWALDGDLSSSFSASGTSNMQLTGSVLESINNEEEPVLMRLREFIKPRVWYEGLVDIVTTVQHLTANTSPEMWGIYSDGSYTRINYSRSNIMLVFTPASGSSGISNASDSTYTCDNVTYNVTGKFTLSSASGSVIVNPAIVWKDENGTEELVILTDISCSIPV